jgi:transposase
MVKYREILRLTAMGISQRNVAFSVGCAPSTVQDVLRAAKAVGLEWPLPEEMDDPAIRSRIYPATDRSDPGKAEIDHVWVDREMRKPNVTMTLLWNEYADAAISQGKHPLAKR